VAGFGEARDVVNSYLQSLVTVPSTPPPAEIKVRGKKASGRPRIVTE
jgi:hypothetical protein